MALLQETLTERLAQTNKKFTSSLPPLYLDKKLVANATYRNDSIFMGNVQRVFHTFDDSLSLIYHEYIHHLLQQKNKYAVAEDDTGEIIQWDTGEFYKYEPFPEEISLSLLFFVQEVLPTYDDYAEMSTQKKEKIIKEMKKVFSKKQQIPFIYAPSNLALEEIYAYRQQQKGEKLGLYVLSEEARMSLRVRIKQLKDTYLRRRKYEKRKKLRPSGEKKG